MTVSTMTHHSRVAHHAHATRGNPSDHVEAPSAVVDIVSQPSKSRSADCGQCTARRHGVCASLAVSDLGAAQHYRDHEIAVSRKSEIYAQWDPSNYVHTVLEGWVMLYQLLDDGRRQVIGIALPGDLIGFKADPNMVIDHTAEALTDAKLCRFSRKDFDDMLASHPELYIRLAAMLERDIERGRQRLTSVGRKTAYERVAEFLIDIYVRVRARAPQPMGSTIVLPLIQDQIGDAIGLTSVHVNRMLRQLRENDLVLVHDGTLHVLDPDGLAEAAGIDAPEDIEEIW